MHNKNRPPKIVFFLVLIFQLVFLLSTAQGKVLHLGKIDFKNSGSVYVQEDFNTAVLLLHSFEYEEARELFQQVQKKDPGFPLAYWGEAMSYNHPIWAGGEQDLVNSRLVLKKFGSTREERLAAINDDREKTYWTAIETLLGEGTKPVRDSQYSAKMAELSARYPADLEAKAFYALSLLGSTEGDRNVRTYIKAAAVAQEILAADPHHPGGLHYFIHSVDDPDHAPLGMAAAKIYGELIQGAEHALHMPSHIYAPLGLWQGVITANEKSWQANDEQAKANNRPPRIGKIHALLWLHYGYLQAGRYQDARRALDEVAQSVKDGPTIKTRAMLAQMQARDALTNPLPSIDFPSLKIDDLEVASGSSDLFRRAWLAIEKKDFAKATQYQKEIEKNLARARVFPTTKVTCQCGGDNKKILESKGLIQATEIMIDQLRAKIFLGKGDTRRALDLLRATVAKADGIPYADGPPLPVKPAHELLADVLFELKKYAEAKKEYEASLNIFVNRSESLLGAFKSARHLGSGSGDGSAAGYLRQLQVNWEQADPISQKAIEER